MKTLFLGLILSISSVSMAQQGLGESDPQQCGCLQCLREHGVCTSNLANEGRVPAKDNKAPSQQTKKGKAGATKG